VDKRIAHTVAYLLKCPASSVPQAMRTYKYSDKESSDATKQMAVRRAWKAVSKPKKKSSPPSSIGASKVGSPASTVSPITTAITGSSSSPSTRSRTRTPTTPTTPSSRRQQRTRRSWKGLLTRRLTFRIPTLVGMQQCRRRTQLQQFLISRMRNGSR
jgi:hypothetical protein